MKLLAAMAAGLMVVGCMPSTVSRPNTTNAELQQDFRECEYEGQKASPANYLLAQQVARQCLKVRGYEF